MANFGHLFPVKSDLFPILKRTGNTKKPFLFIYLYSFVSCFLKKSKLYNKIENLKKIKL